ncbi:DUF4174 domain-containing protein [Ferrimonas balearica]|uniref:DUF4174 domain-containing protein n=1 Tax=Ferrimonas balearica TaxID=44012 RepID=UPI001C99F7E2|nr:DUF4174 domain-containing protein [Ferrimonas balearica]MBY5993107.1 DUF4174 domain-containing protein [Ferrimonas balearica]
MFTLFLSLIGRIIGAVILATTMTLTPHLSQADPLSALRWHHRALLVFAPTHSDPEFVTQGDWLSQMERGLRERDLLVFRVVGESVEMEGRLLSEPKAHLWREDFIIPRDEFTVVLIGKDGQVKLHQDSPTSEEQLFRLIDAMPLRQQEMGMGRL